MKQVDKFTPQETLAVWMAVQKTPFYAAELKASICKKLLSNTSFAEKSGRGRPKKGFGQDADTRRALIVDHIADQFPELSTEECIHHARSMAEWSEQFRTVPEFRAWFPQDTLAEMDTEGGKFAAELLGLLPVGQTLDATLLQSVSRGRGKSRKE